MELLFASTGSDVPQYRARRSAFAPRSFGLILGSLVIFVSLAAFATGASEQSRFQLVGSGTLTLDQPILKSGNVQLKASLTPSDGAISVSQTVQDGGRFSLTALLSTSSLVCYNDTIFRDDFDGDGF